MKTPRITLDALEGLTRAISYLEADDLTDDSDEQVKQLEAASDWIRKAWQINQKGE